jgi:DNA-binding transcriptional ArsR family regulator
MGLYAQYSRHGLQNSRRSDPPGDFERLVRDGEQTVRVLTGNSGVSQPAVSKHLAVLKLAGLVRDRHEGPQTHYSAEPQGAPDRLDESLWRILGRLEDVASGS